VGREEEEDAFLNQEDEEASCHVIYQITHVFNPQEGQDGVTFHTHLKQS
jgi:hypothetical protein